MKHLFPWRKKKKAVLQPSPPLPDASVALASNIPATDGRSIPSTPNLWERAYDDLKIKEEKLVYAYESILSREMKEEPLDADVLNLVGDAFNDINQTSPEKRKSQMDFIIKQGLERMDDKKIKYRFAGADFVLQDQAAEAAKFALSVKDFVGQAVQSCPQASLAWSGVCLLLPIFTNPSTADKANIDGVAYVASKLRWYCALEELLLPKNSKPSPDDLGKELREEFGSHVLTLYSLLLEFQMKSACRYYESRIRNLGQDIFNSGDWEDMISRIKEQEIALESETRQINTERSLLELRGINEKSEAALGIFNGLFSFAGEQLSISKEHRDISAQHLELSKRKEQREITKEEEKCLQMFSRTDYKWYKDSVEERIEGTCGWFLTQEHYRTWLEQSSGILLVSADPGCGKSVLARYLIDTQLPRSATIAYFFFKDKDQNNVKQALCALLHQIFSQNHNLMKYGTAAIKSRGENLPTLFTELWSVLITAAADPQAGEIICVLDALDECEQSEMRTLTQALIRHFTHRSDQSSKLKFLLTSRPYDSVVIPFQGLIKEHPYIRIPGENEDASQIISTEVNAVIRKKVETLKDEFGMDPPLAEHLLSLLLQITHRTYLWVYLVFDFLKTRGFKKTVHGVQDAISILPKSVADAYEEILQRPSDLDSDKSRTRKILSIIIAAGRPLTLAEMNIALEVTPSCRSIEDLDLESESDFKEAIRQCCGLFVSVHHSQVYLIHQTAREFLTHKLSNEEAHPEEGNGTVTQPHTAKELPPGADPKAKTTWKHSISLEKAHRILAESCVAYLSFDAFNSGACESPAILDRRLEMNPLYEYASTNWGHHVRSALIETEPIVIRFLESEAKVSASGQVWTEANPKYSYGYFQGFRPIIGVQLATYFSLCEAIEALIDNGQHPDVKDYTSDVPLLSAAKIGNVAVVKLLLEKGASPDFRDEREMTPLFYATENGDTAVATLLLENGANPNIPRHFGFMPLEVAASRGDVAIIKVLLENHAHLNHIARSDGSTPLIQAAEAGQVAVVKLFLENGADRDIADDDNETALSRAAANGSVDVVKLLLEHGADVDIRTNDYTPLMKAASLGHLDVVRLLLDNGARADDLDMALAKARDTKHEDVAELLIEYGANEGTSTVGFR